jgi:DNA adenine methylase
MLSSRSLVQNVSPLRYPGGKGVLSGFIADVMRENGIVDGTYVEPFAGGAGAGVALLVTERVRRLVINDADPAIAAFWSAALFDTTRFLRMLTATPVTIEEWQRQQAIYRSKRKISALRLGFAAFYLNRCNRSGIIKNAGPVGGKHQSGRWRIDARFPKEELARRIEHLARFRARITVTNEDAVVFLRSIDDLVGDRGNRFIYLDPPYYEKGPQLYLNAYGPEDHAMLAAEVRCLAPHEWLMTYDDVSPIRRLYRGMRVGRFGLSYSAQERRVGGEVLIHDRTLVIPKFRLAHSGASARSRSGSSKICRSPSLARGARP